MFRMIFRPNLLPHISSMKAALPTSCTSLVEKVTKPSLLANCRIWSVRFFIEKKRVASWVFALLCFAIAPAFADYTFKIQPRSYLLSTHYDLYTGDSYLSTVEQNSLQLRRIYSLCHERGETARGTARLLSLGALLNSLKEIDVEDNRGRTIGFIQGEWWTTASGRFQFYDEARYNIATAFVDRSGSSVSIVDAQNQRSPIAIFRRSYVPGGDYYWEVKVVKEEAVDPRMIYIFSAFITDVWWPAAPIPEDRRSSTLEALQAGVLLKSLLDDRE